MIACDVSGSCGSRLGSSADRNWKRGRLTSWSLSASSSGQRSRYVVLTKKDRGFWRRELFSLCACSTERRARKSKISSDLHRTIQVAFDWLSHSIGILFADIYSRVASEKKRFQPSVNWCGYCVNGTICRYPARFEARQLTNNDFVRVKEEIIVFSFFFFKENSKAASHTKLSKISLSIRSDVYLSRAVLSALVMHKGEKLWCVHKHYRMIRMCR